NFVFMGSCASTGVEKVESPVRSLSGTVIRPELDPNNQMTPTRRTSSMTPKGFDQNNFRRDSPFGQNTTVELLDMGR
ncbi:unnamed protein product, partial [Calicophoron daubneyi]